MAISHCSAIENALTEDDSTAYSGAKWQKVGQSGALGSPADRFMAGKSRVELSAHFRPPGRCEWRRVAENAGRVRATAMAPVVAPSFAALLTSRSTPKADWPSLLDIATRSSRTRVAGSCLPPI